MACGARGAQPAARDVKLGAVVGHQPGAAVDQAQRQIGFARAAVAQEQHALARRCATQLAWMLTGFTRHAHASGQFDDEARAAAGLAGLAEMRFSAQMRPPAFWVICRAMERPRPEFLPKCVAGPLGVEALEDGFQILGRNAGAVILHRHARAAVMSCCARDRHRAAVRG